MEALSCPVYQLFIFIHHLVVPPPIVSFSKILFRKELFLGQRYSYFIRF